MIYYYTYTNVYGDRRQGLLYARDDDEFRKLVQKKRDRVIRT